VGEEERRRGGEEERRRGGEEVTDAALGWSAAAVRTPIRPCSGASAVDVE
jgi:hypothetical protein